MIPGVCQKKGSTYRRFRVKLDDGRWGDHYIRLPDPTDPQFAVELARVNREADEGRVKQEARGNKPGSFAALAVLFRERLTTSRLADSTRRNRLYYVSLIENEHGHRQVRDLRPAHVFTLRDRLAATPGKANNYLAVLKLMLALARERGWISENPVVGVPLLSIGEHEPWPVEVQTAALAAASPMLRLAIITGLCSGQRVGDVIQMRHNWHDGQMMRLKQQKTGVHVAVPMHPMWIAELDKHERKAVTLLYDRIGKPFTGTDRIQERIRRLMAEIGHEGYTFHGLRKNACCYLLELGLSDMEVGAVLGMTSGTVRHYGKKADRLVIAKGTVERVLAGRLWETAL